MARCDFVVRYDPQKEAPEELTKRILKGIIIRRLKYKKPAVIFLGGDSGEGKSYSGIRLLELLYEIQGLDVKEFFRDVNIHTPLEYVSKLESLLHDKRLKKANILCMHEAREVVKAKLWYSFVTQAVADVNAMSRTVKRMCFIIISQFIRDITPDIRYTLNFYMKVSRPRNQKPRLYINVLWKDDHDLEKPHLRKRRLSGYIILPNGRYKRYMPQYLIMTKPRKELIEIFEKDDYESKALIIRNKLQKLLTEMKIDAEESTKKVDAMTNYYLKNQDNMELISKRYRNKWILKPEVKEMHGLTSEEVKMFQKKINERFKELGAIENEQPTRQTK